MVAVSANIDDVANKTFNYVIIGGGTAGSTLAARLTENPEVSVLVLEAGAARINDPLIEVPTGFKQQFGNPDYDWEFTTTPQSKLGGRVLTWNRGKGLGGSSNINYMVWTRPGKAEIDAWERLGNPGWNWETFLPYIKKAENFHFPPEEIIKRETLEVEPSSFGTKGPISISFSDMLSGAEPIVRQAFQKRGIPTLGDPLKGSYAGAWCSTSSVNPKTLTRSSAFTGYILPNLSRKNLTILTEAYVLKMVLNEGEILSARGVEFQHGGKTYEVSAGREVILCAGALKSPQILELSGIGDPAVLEPLNIDVKLDLPTVGTNLQDHCGSFSIAFELRDDAPVHSLDVLSDPVELKKFSELYAQKRRGLLSLTVAGVAFLPTQAISDKAQEIIERQAKYLATNPSSIPGVKEQYQIKLEHLMNPGLPDVEIITNPAFAGHINQAEPGKRYISFALGMVTPWSRGTAHIRSADPFEQPSLEANYLAEDIDLSLLTEAFKFSRSLSQYEPFSTIIVKEANPGPAIQTDEEIRAYIVQGLSTLWHAGCTLPMLPKDKGGVVDPSLKVYGTENIRVCDLSVLPMQVAMHPQSVTYGIAEKAADILLGKF